MPYHSLTEIELRDIAKRHVESLEFWLRRIIDETLTKKYGNKYWEQSDGFLAKPNVLKKQIRDTVNARIANSPTGRFPRWIDATLIENIIDITTNDSLYKNIFKPYFQSLFPANFSQGREYLKFIFEKCAVVRNALYHSNPISIRQVEQVVCYTNDLVDSFKNFYFQKNLQSEFNVPSIVSYGDSLGTKLFASQFEYSPLHTIRLPLAYKIRCGDKITMFVEVDASFNSDEYDINWTWGSLETIGKGPEMTIELNEAYVGENVSIKIKILSKQGWHRFGSFDDILIINFQVLPPLQ